MLFTHYILLIGRRF